MLCLVHPKHTRPSTKPLSHQLLGESQIYRGLKSDVIGQQVIDDFTFHAVAIITQTHTTGTSTSGSKAFDTLAFSAGLDGGAIERYIIVLQS
jgi:hypothetical protein